VGNIIKEMSDNVPYGMAGLNVFLSALMTIPVIEFCITIEADFFGSFPGFGHVKF